MIINLMNQRGNISILIVVGFLLLLTLLGAYKFGYIFHTDDTLMPYSTVKIKSPVNSNDTYLDTNIFEATTDADYVQTSLSSFPNGLFSNNSDEWGLINYSNSPVTVTVNFINPVTLASIENLFTHCPFKNYPNGYQGDTGCYYQLSIVGVTEDDESVTFLSEKKIYPSMPGDGLNSATVDYVYYLNSDLKLKSLIITAKRMGKDLNDYVHWKKIRIAYKV